MEPSATPRIHRPIPPRGSAPPSRLAQIRSLTGEPLPSGFALELGEGTRHQVRQRHLFGGSVSALDQERETGGLLEEYLPAGAAREHRARGLRDHGDPAKPRGTPG